MSQSNYSKLVSAACRALQQEFGFRPPRSHVVIYSGSLVNGLVDSVVFLYIPTGKDYIWSSFFGLLLYEDYSD